MDSPEISETKSILKHYSNERQRSENGTEKSHFRTSFGYSDNDGVFPTESLSRVNADLNAGTELNKWVSMDGKTPWSFTPVWYWDSVLHVQDRWETEKLERQFQWSHCWDTTPAVLGF